jgi:hypothetical protein
VATERRDSWRNWRATFMTCKKLEGPLCKVPQTGHGKPPVLPKQRTEVPRTGHGTRIRRIRGRNSLKQGKRTPRVLGEIWDGTRKHRRREPPSFVETGDETRNRPQILNKPSQRGFHCTSNLATWAPKKNNKLFLFVSKKKKL